MRSSLVGKIETRDATDVDHTTDALERGDISGLPTCNTRSTDPMSIPISNDEDVTTARRWPYLSRFSTFRRMFLSIEP